MRVSFFYPPVGNGCQPYLSTPTLVAHLKQHGVTDVHQYDFNLEAVDALLSVDRLRRAYRWCYHFLNEFDRRRSVSDLDLAQAQLALASFPSAQKVVADIDRAKQIFRTPEFHDRPRYLDALDTVLSSYRLLSSRHFPTMVENQSFRMRYRLDSSEEVLAAVEDDAENCFVEILSNKLDDAFDADGVPDIAGVSIGYYEQLVPGLTLARLIKERSPRTHVTVGGTMMSALVGKVFRPEFFRFFDSIVFFEAEAPLLKLIDAVETGTGFDGIPNLALLRDGHVVSTGIASSQIDANSIPTPDFSGLPLSQYFSPEPILPVAASRGCYWRKCTFCTRQHLLDTFRQRSPDRIVGDLKRLMETYGARAFFFVDECVSPRILEGMADRILAERLEIRWSCYVRFEKKLGDPALCRKLARSGLRMLYFGLESACDRVVGLMKKGTTKDGMATVLDATASAGILNMILYFVGFPTETRDEALETMEFLLDNRDHVTFAIPGQFMLEEHSPIFESPAGFGITEISPLGPSSDLGIIYRYTVNRGMSAEEAAQVRDYVDAQTTDLHALQFLNRSHLLLFRD